MSNNITNEILNSDNDTVLYSWTSFPLIDYPKKSILLFLMIAVITYIVWELAMVTWKEPFWYFFGLIIFLFALMPYFVPTTYYFYNDRFKVQYPFFKVEKNYKDYSCFYVDKMGIMLSTFVQPRRLDAFRGQSIRFSKSKEEKEQIVDLLKTKIGKQY